MKKSFAIFFLIIGLCSCSFLSAQSDIEQAKSEMAQLMEQMKSYQSYAELKEEIAELRKEMANIRQQLLTVNQTIQKVHTTQLRQAQVAKTAGGCGSNCGSNNAAGCGGCGNKAGGCGSGCGNKAGGCAGCGTKANAQQAKAKPKVDTKVYKINTAGAPFLGPENAPVTIVEFVDFECPYCIREFPVINHVLKTYPDQVKVVFKHYPLSFHKKAKPVHVATQLVYEKGGNDLFWAMHDMIMENPKKLSISDMKGYIKQLNVDIPNLNAILSDQKQLNQKLLPHLREARTYGVRGTPSIFINGKRLASRTFQGYKARIDEIIIKEKAVVKAQATPGVFKDKMVEVGCGKCIYHIDGVYRCHLAAKIDGQTYLATYDNPEFNIHTSGLMQKSEKVKLSGKLVGKRLVVSELDL